MSPSSCRPPRTCPTGCGARQQPCSRAPRVSPRHPGPVRRDLPPAVLSGEPPQPPACPRGQDSRRLQAGAEDEGREAPSLPSTAAHSRHRFVSWGVRPKVTPGAGSCVCVQRWTEGWCHDPQGQGLGTSSWAYARPLRWGCAEHPQGRGKRRGKVLRGSASATPGNVVPKNLDVGSPSSRVELWPHGGTWAAATVQGLGCPFQGVSQAWPCLTESSHCVRTRPQHPAQHGVLDGLRHSSELETPRL